MKKKVAVLLPWLKMGGTNKIALNFMKELSQYCNVTLILSENIGELFPELSPEIHLVIDEMKDFKEIFSNDIKRLNIANIIRDVHYYAKICSGRDSIDNYRYIVDRNSSICDLEFDCAISYHGQSPERLLNLLYRINAKKKVVWIHGEMSFSEDKCFRLRKYYNEIDHFFFVSNATRESFIKIFPLKKEKTTVYYNPIDREEILKRANEKCEIEFEKNFINLLTVGRLSSEKGQDMIPIITKKILSLGYRIKWYIIGDGDTRDKLEGIIRDENVTDNVILLGVKTNPYCYMKACDIYVQPSYTEGYSTTICEAGILGKAIIGTKPSGGIRDQITDREDGLIVDATVEGLSEGIIELLNNRDMIHTFEENIMKKNFEGKGEIRKFLSFLNETN